MHYLLASSHAFTHTSHKQTTQNRELPFPYAIFRFPPTNLVINTCIPFTFTHMHSHSLIICTPIIIPPPIQPQNIIIAPHSTTPHPSPRNHSTHTCILKFFAMQSHAFPLTFSAITLHHYTTIHSLTHTHFTQTTFTCIHMHFQHKTHSKPWPPLHFRIPICIFRFPAFPFIFQLSFFIIAAIPHAILHHSSTQTP